MSKINITKPTKFRLKLSSCGTNTFSGSYERFEDSSAMSLLFDVVNIVSKDFVGREQQLALQYDLACIILNSLNGWDKEKLLDSLDDKELEKKLIDKWTMKVD